MTTKIYSLKNININKEIIINSLKTIREKENKKKQSIQVASSSTWSIIINISYNAGQNHIILMNIVICQFKHTHTHKYIMRTFFFIKNGDWNIIFIKNTNIYIYKKNLLVQFL